MLGRRGCGAPGRADRLRVPGEPGRSAGTPPSAAGLQVPPGLPARGALPARVLEHPPPARGR
ncbi:hypothetical protein CRUP_007615 [Coryphaenoides rupestris]|nr:hypothetical protein CRUP_007615 [Coryphaenoides rupestris]